MHGFEIALASFFEGGNGEAGEGVFEPEHGSLTMIFFIAWSTVWSA